MYKNIFKLVRTVIQGKPFPKYVWDEGEQRYVPTSGESRPVYPAITNEAHFQDDTNTAEKPKPSSVIGFVDL
jgi:hypothetical protein